MYRFRPRRPRRTWLLSLALLALPACRQAPPRATVRFWHFWSEPRQQAALDSLMATFRTRHPDIEVALTPLLWTDGDAKLFAAFNAGTAPDVVHLGIEWIAAFAAAGVLRPPAIDGARPWLPAALAAARWHDTLRATPWMVNTRALFVNRTMFAAAGLALPRSWDDLRHAARVLHDRGVAAFGATADQAHALYKKVLPFLWQNGGELFTPDGRSAAVDTPQNVEALATYVALCDAGTLDASRALDERFARGSLAIWISGAWLVDRIAATNPGLDYAVVPMCTPRGEGIGWSILGGDYLAASGASAKPAAAETLMHFLTEPEQMRRFAALVSDAGEPADTAAAQPAAPGVKAALHAQIVRSRAPRPVARWLEIEAVLERAFGETLYHRVTPADALRAASAKIDTLLRATP